jgi:hypothetical protein
MQQLAHTADVDELLYGGAAGGGKTEMLLAEAIKLLTLVPNSKVLLLRRTFPEIEQEIVPRLLSRIPRKIGRYNSSKHVMIFFNNSQLRLGSLEKDVDVYRYLGAEYQLILFDELTTMNIMSYRYLKSRVRAAGQVRDDMARFGFRPKMISATNPGGRSHHEVKSMFVDPAPPMTAFAEKTGQTRMYIPAKLEDNPHLDADYRARLESLPEHLRRALLEGDWDILEGVRFAVWRTEMHVIAPTSPEEFFSYPRCVAVDYGFAAPFAAVWLAKLPDDRIIQYRELYDTELTAKQQAQAILDAEMPGERGPTRPIPVVMDPSMWRRGEGGNHGPLGDSDSPPVGTPAHNYQTILNQRPIKAMNARVPGWALMDEYLMTHPDGTAHFQVTNNCRDTIRTIPALPRAKANPEDVDTTSEDHLGDAVRYGVQFLTGARDDATTRRREPTDVIPPLTGSLASAGF